MKTWTKAIIGIVLSFCTLFSSLGYAALTTNLSITGEATVSPPDSLFLRFRIVPYFS